MTKITNKRATLAEHQQALYVLLAEFDRVCKILGIKYFLFAGTLLGAVRHNGFIPWDDDLDIIMLRDDYDRFMREAPAVLNEDKFYLQVEFSEHWPMFFSKLRLNGTTCIEKYYPKDNNVHMGVYIDLFPCDYAAKTLFGRKLQFYSSKVVIAKSLYTRGYETNSSQKKAFMFVCKLLPLNPFLWLTKHGRDDSGYLHSFLGGSSKFSRSVYPSACFADSESISFEEGNFPVPVLSDAVLSILYDDYMTIPPEEDRKCKEHAFFVDLENSYENYGCVLEGMVFTTHTKSIR